MFGRLGVIAESQLRKIYSHPPVRQVNSSGIVRFANVITNTVTVLNRLGFQHEIELEGDLGSATNKFSFSLKSSAYDHYRIIKYWPQTWLYTKIN